jgi:hypothetical protein
VLVALKGNAAYPHLCVLALGNVTSDGDAGDADVAAQKIFPMIRAGCGARTPRNTPGTCKCVMSWIWTTPGTFNNKEEHSHDCEWEWPAGTGIDTNTSPIWQSASNGAACVRAR